MLKARKLDLQPLNENAVYIPDSSENDWDVADETTITEIKNAINNLPEKYSTVLNMYLLEGYDHQEIADIMDMSENTSRTILHRGRIQLKEQLKHLQYGTGY